MPKQRVTRESIVEAAFQIAREGGMEAVLVKDVAAALGCSVQPIYSYCGSMEGLRQAVEQRTASFVRDYVAAHRDAAAPFRSVGLAHLRLAREEPHLFRVFYARRQEAVSSLEAFYAREANPNQAASLAENLGLTLAAAKSLHLHMLLYTTGVGFLLAAGANLSEEALSAQMDLAYAAFLHQAREASK